VVYKDLDPHGGGRRRQR